MKIKIPSPCFENYNKMTPTVKGSICHVCNTEVIDFTNWETEDIVTYIQNSKHKICGRIIKQSYANSKTRNTWLKIASTFLILTSWSSQVQAIDYNNLSISNTYYRNINKQFQQESVTLVITDSKSRNLDGVILINTASKQIYNSDSLGRIILSGPITDIFDFEIKSIGYKTKKIQLAPSNKNKTLKIVLEDDSYEIGEIIVEPINKIKPIDKGPKKLKPLI